MTTKMIANLALGVIGIGLMLGNYWYTFGLWPRSWVSFVGFAAASIVVLVLRTKVDSEKSA